MNCYEEILGRTFIDLLTSEFSVKTGANLLVERNDSWELAGWRLSCVTVLFLGPAGAGGRVDSVGGRDDSSVSACS